MRKVKVLIKKIDYDGGRLDEYVGQTLTAYVWEGVKYPYYVTQDGEHPDVHSDGAPLYNCDTVCFSASEVEVID